MPAPWWTLTAGSRTPRFGLSISWSGKRNFAGRHSRAISGAERGRTVGIRFADRDPAPTVQDKKPRAVGGVRRRANERRLHQALGYRAPMAVWRDGAPLGTYGHVDNANASTTCPQPDQKQQTVPLAA